MCCHLQIERLTLSFCVCCQLCNGTAARTTTDSCGVPFAFTSFAPPSTTIVASKIDAANVNMDASQFTVGPYYDFAVSTWIASAVVTGQA